MALERYKLLAAQNAAESAAFFAENDLVPALAGRESRLHSGNAAARDEYAPALHGGVGELCLGLV